MNISNISIWIRNWIAMAAFCFAVAGFYFLKYDFDFGGFLLVFGVAYTALALYPLLQFQFKTK